MRSGNKILDILRSPEIYLVSRDKSVGSNYGFGFGLLHVEIC